MDYGLYIKNVLETNSKTMEIKKNAWNKDLSKEKVIINNSIADMPREMALMIKIIFYLDYISDVNLRTITLPILSDNRFKVYMKVLKNMKLIKEYKKGLGKCFYQLGTRGYDLLSDKEFSSKNVSSKRNSLSGRSNATIEDNDLRAAFLGEKVLEEVVKRFEKKLSEFSADERESYILNLFIQNISFNIVADSITSNPSMQNHLSDLGFTENEELQFFKMKNYNLSLRKTYSNKVQSKMLNEACIPLGYEEYYQSYKDYINKTKGIFERYFFFSQIQEFDTEIDYITLISNTIKSYIQDNPNTGNASNLIKYQTDDVRNRLLFCLEDLAKRNGNEVNISNKLKLDDDVYKLNNDISISNAIISNLKRMEKSMRTSKEANPEDYKKLVDLIEVWEKKRQDKQKEYANKRTTLEFTDPISKRGAGKPLIAIYELERKNVLISNILRKKDSKTGKYFLEVDLVKLDREKNIENFSSFQQRRDYFGPEEFFDVIADETGVDIKVVYTYCYPEGSRILDYESRLDKIFTNKGLANTTIKAPDELHIHKIENRLSYDEYMANINKKILG